jgi:hypothetical protein
VEGDEKSRIRGSLDRVTRFVDGTKGVLDETIRRENPETALNREQAMSNADATEVFAFIVSAPTEGRFKNVREVAAYDRK